MEAQNNEWSNWINIIKPYTRPSIAKSWWQVINSFVPYVILWVIMVYSLRYSYLITLALSVLAAGFLVRIFIIFHDCGHNSFFKSRRLNKIVGIIAGALVFTPYHKWHYQHMVHHKTVGDLDKRGMGDIKILTVKEYKNSTKRQRLFYRLYRNPIILFLIAPFFLFAIFFRFPDKKLSKKINLYSHITTVSIIAAITIISFMIGLKTYVLIQIPVLYFASAFGVWLFYLQHQFEDVMWERTTNWDYTTIAMDGSSFVKFPAILQWFSGNIGFHHIHHLSPKVPNYNLEKCYKENPLFQKKPMTFMESLRAAKYSLWDEEKQKLVSFKEALS
ncbi:fatty acid desaturase [Geofilum sp. OHC36d9]|uniref:fatty acid desaturase n=1 Tax=Geofilum sp. OHC36d9 TaxID=3458413 RepID=UPI0040337530